MLIARIIRKFPFISMLLSGIIVSLKAFTPSTASESVTPNFIVNLTDDQSWVGTSYLNDPDDPRTISVCEQDFLNCSYGFRPRSKVMNEE